MSDDEAGFARRAGGRRIASRPETDTDESVAQPTPPLVPSDVMPGNGRRRRAVAPAESSPPSPDDADDDSASTAPAAAVPGRPGAHVAPIPVDHGAPETPPAEPASTVPAPEPSTVAPGGSIPIVGATSVATSGRATITIPESEPQWPFLNSNRTAAHWVAPLVGPQAPSPPSYNDARRARALASSQAHLAQPTVARSTESEPAGDPDGARPDVDGAPLIPDPVDTPAPTQAPVQGPVEPPAPLGEEHPASTASAAETAHAPAAGRRIAGTPRRKRAPAIILMLIWLAAVAVSGGRLAAVHDLWSPPDDVTRVGSVVATWLAIVVLARRCGGRFILIGLFSAVVLGLVTAYPENWALAGAGVTAASVYGVLGMTLTRPASGLRTLLELLVSALIGAAGAVVVTGYDVELRPFRFRIMVLTLVLIGGFALAWRLGQGANSLGRRGLVLIGGGVLVLALSIAYTQAIRAWGSPGFVASVTDVKNALEDRLGAVPRPIEALVGFPALVWGVAIRSRRRQGWWMCAFGGLGAAGLATSLIQPATPFVDSLAATGYDLVIGGFLGLVLVGLDRLLTGRGRRAAAARAAALAERPEPPRFAPLL